MPVLGVVGLGKMGLLHASILSALSDVEVVVFCEKNSLVRKFAPKVLPTARIVANVTEMRGFHLDGVYVTTPPASHFPVVETLYSQGIATNIFIEKPLAANYAEALQLCQLAGNWGGVNMVGYHKRFSMIFRKAKSILEEDGLGKVTDFEAYAYSSDFYDAPQAMAQAVARGGVLRDSGCHAVDLVLWFLGEVTVDSSVIKSPLTGDQEDSAAALVRTSEGIPGEIKLSSCMQAYRLPQIGLHLRGTKGSLHVNEDKVELLLNGGKSHTWYRHDFDDSVPFLLADPEYCREDQRFVDALLHGAAVESNFQVAAGVEQLIDHIQQAAGPLFGR